MGLAVPVGSIGRHPHEAGNCRDQSLYSRTRQGVRTSASKSDTLHVRRVHLLALGRTRHDVNQYDVDVHCVLSGKHAVAEHPVSRDSGDLGVDVGVVILQLVIVAVVPGQLRRGLKAAAAGPDAEQREPRRVNDCL